MKIILLRLRIRCRAMALEAGLRCAMVLLRLGVCLIMASSMEGLQVRRQVRHPIGGRSSRHTKHQQREKESTTLK